jgi:serine/threonine-protein kinase RsbW/stage II sporulation protein AB (anti-sigma F factor)
VLGELEREDRPLRPAVNMWRQQKRLERGVGLDVIGAEDRDQPAVGHGPPEEVRDMRQSRALTARRAKPLKRDLYEGYAPARAENLAALRKAVWRHAQSLGATEETAAEMRLAVGEASTNVVMHAYVDMERGSMMVQAWLDEDGRYTVRVHDDGRGLVPRTDSPGLGVGLGVIAQMADDFRVTNRVGTPGTRVSMRFTPQGAIPGTERAELAT